MYKFMLLLWLALFITGCRNAAEPTLIGLSLPTQREERWVRDKEAMIAESERLGLKLATRVSDNDAVLQIQQSKELLDLGVNVLILAPHDARSAATIVDMAHQRQVPVISYDRLVLDSKVDVYLSFDNWEVGRIQARYLAKSVPSGNYVVMSGSPTDNNSKMFYEGAMEILQPKISKGEINLIFDNPIRDWKPSEALRMMDMVLAKTSNFQAILAPNDSTARGIIAALEKQDMAGRIPVTGQDGEIAAAKLIVEGKQSMTVFKDTRELGKAAIAIALRMNQDQPIPGVTTTIHNGASFVPSVLLMPELVTKNNLDQVLINSGYIRHEDVYGAQ